MIPFTCTEKPRKFPTQKLVSVFKTAQPNHPEEKKVPLTVPAWKPQEIFTL